MVTKRKAEKIETPKQKRSIRKPGEGRSRMPKPQFVRDRQDKKKAKAEAVAAVRAANLEAMGQEVPDQTIPTKPSLRAMRVGDAVRDENDPFKSKDHTYKGLKIIVVVLVICAVALAVIAALFSGSNKFTIEQLAVRGVKHLTETEIVQLADIPDEATLLRIDTEAVRARMLKDAWVQDVVVTRIFPKTLGLTVTERKVGAVAEVPSSDASVTRMWALSTDGLWIMPIPDPASDAAKLVNPQIYEDIESVLHITDVPYGTQPEIGTFCNDSNVNNALNIVAGMTTELASKVVTVKATDSESTTLILENGVEIAFGSADDIRDKERVCLELLERFANQVAYINVRVVDSPTWRSI